MGAYRAHGHRLRGASGVVLAMGAGMSDRLSLRMLETAEVAASSEAAGLCIEIRRSWDEIRRLREFAQWAFEQSFEGYDLDGGDVQDMGIKTGLLESRKVNPDENEWEADELYFPVWSDA